MIGTAHGGIKFGAGLIAALIAATALVGCGSGDGRPLTSSTAGGTQAGDSAHGSLQFRLVFPKSKRSVTPAKPGARGVIPGGFYDGSIPFGSHSVKISVTNPTTGALLAPARVVNDATRPDGVTGTIAVGFGLLPVGLVNIAITAHPDLEATGNPLATGTGTATIVANDTAFADMLLTLTLKNLSVTPPTQTLHTLMMPFPSGMVDAQAQDAQGKPILYPLEYSTDNTGVLEVTEVSADFMHATVTPKIFVEGQGIPVTVTVTEPNSGATEQVQVIVAP